MKFASIPSDVVLANSCNYILEDGKSNQSYKLFLLGVLNSELINWRFSLTNTNNHVSNRELTQLPIVDLRNSESRELATMLIDEVKRLKTNEIVPRIEALVFAIYGFSSKDSAEILNMRFTPMPESEAILDELKNLAI